MNRSVEILRDPLDLSWLRYRLMFLLCCNFSWYSWDQAAFEPTTGLISWRRLTIYSFSSSMRRWKASRLGFCFRNERSLLLQREQQPCTCTSVLLDLEMLISRLMRCQFSTLMEWVCRQGVRLVGEWLMVLRQDLSRWSLTWGLALRMLWQWCALFWKQTKSSDLLIDINFIQPLGPRIPIRKRRMLIRKLIQTLQYRLSYVKGFNYHTPSRGQISISSSFPVLCRLSMKPLIFWASLLSRSSAKLKQQWALSLMHFFLQILPSSIGMGASFGIMLCRVSSSWIASSNLSSFTSVLAFWNLFSPFFGSNFSDFLNSSKASAYSLFAARVIPMNENKTGFLGFISIALLKNSQALSYLSCLQVMLPCPHHALQWRGSKFIACSNILLALAKSSLQTYSWPQSEKAQGLQGLS